MTPARIAKLRLHIMKGYSSEAVAKRIVKVAEKPFAVRMHEIRKRYLLKRLGLAL